MTLLEEITALEQRSLGFDSQLCDLILRLVSRHNTLMDVALTAQRTGRWDKSAEEAVGQEIDALQKFVEAKYKKST